jgi:hypothetical protein
MTAWPGVLTWADRAASRDRAAGCRRALVLVS